MVILFKIKLNPKQSEFFVETLLSHKSEIYSDWNIDPDDNSVTWKLDNPNKFFSDLENWQSGETFAYCMTESLGLRLLDWAEMKGVEILQKIGAFRGGINSVETELDLILLREIPNPLSAKLEKKRKAAGKGPYLTKYAKLSKKDQVAVRGLLLIVTNMRLFSGWGRGKTLDWTTEYF